jgi:hypothetical protein
VTISITQTSSAGTNTGASSPTCSAALAGVASLACLISYCNIGGNPSSAAPPSLSVSDGTAYTQLAQGTNQFGGSGTAYNDIGIFFLPGVSSGSHTAIATSTAGNFNAWGYEILQELSGVKTSSPQDITAGGTTGNGNPANNASCGTLGPFAQAAEIVLIGVSVSGTGNQSITVPSGFTDVTGALNNTAATYADVAQGDFSYQIISATSSLTPSYSGLSSGNAYWVTVGGSLEAAGTEIYTQLERSHRGVNRGVSTGRA